ncbi:MAG TPA: hypothetical protein P5080_01580 [Candidatus Paceibacterota bacterium]|nr:hypothetical protein [Candidatus Pacearchaeota archaeon]HRZ50721.1 hypothetical protein [Candidatus Paceibacterota bacterium]HSA36382.1 hypothetical protein [Candidatus Paceibacterota bacterium]
MFKTPSNPKLRDLVRKEFETHPEGITIGEMCALIERMEVLIDFDGYKVLRTMVDLGMIMAPYQKHYRGRHKGGCPLPFEVSYTLPSLRDACKKFGMKSAIINRLEKASPVSIKKLKKNFPFDLSDDESKRLFNEALEELIADRKIFFVPNTKRATIELAASKIA